MVFFAIWWAWMNFTWFRLCLRQRRRPLPLTVLVQIAGSLVMAAGIPRLFNDGDSLVVVVGYVIMRMAMVDPVAACCRFGPTARKTALRLRGRGDGGADRLAGHPGRAIEPVRAGIPDPGCRRTSSAGDRRARQHDHFHPHHIAERYGLFTVIVLGESVTAATLAFQGALDETENSGTLIGMAVAGIVTLFCLWWVYFDHEANPRLNTARASFSWG
jgi:low temperature requirement protein LtrA